MVLREVAFALIKLVVVVVPPLLAHDVSSLAIFESWVVGSCVMMAISVAVLLPRAQPGYRFHLDAAVAWGMFRSSARLAIVNHAVSLAMSVPVLFVPLLVTGLVSPTMYAYFYAAWMVANMLFVVPGAVSGGLFAEGSADPARLANASRVALLAGGAVGIVGMIGILALGEVLLLALGPSYASNATVLLRTLSIGVIPLTVVYVYEGTQRARRTLSRAAVNMALSGGWTLLLVTVGSMLGGFEGIGVGWLVAQFSIALYLLPEVMASMSLKVNSAKSQMVPVEDASPGGPCW